MEIATLFFKALFDLSNAMSVYILFGLLFAGILHESIPESIITKHLGKESIASVIKATLFGIPLPVCSCGVIPLAASIKKSGASKGATLSFLVSTPITGIDSILATFGMFGWIFTLYRAISSMIIALSAGIITNIFDKTDVQENITIKTSKEGEDCCCQNAASCSSEKSLSKKMFFTRVLDYAFSTLFSDIAKPLLWGLILGALITIAIPQDLSSLLSKYYWISYLIAIAIAVPMYVCATASLPIAAGLMLSGVSAGAAFVFLSAGPATNTVTIGVVKDMLGKKALYIYLGSIVFGSIIFGLGLDIIFDINSIDIKKLIQTDEDVAVLEIISSILLWVLMLFYLLKHLLAKK